MCVKILGIWFQAKGCGGMFPVGSRVRTGVLGCQGFPERDKSQHPGRCQNPVLSTEFCLQRPPRSESAAVLENVKTVM